MIPAFKKLLMGVVDRNEGVTSDGTAMLQSAMVSTNSLSARPGTRGRRNLDVGKVCSYELIRALDHNLCLMGCGGLYTFLPLAQQSRVLQAGEVRYLVETAPWGSFQVPPGTPWKRSVVKNVVSGEKRFEQPSVWPNGGDMPLLVLGGDEASPNLTSYQWLSGRMHLRVAWVRDSAHRCWNDAKLGLQAADCWCDILETLQIIQTLHGPWSSKAWYKQLVESAKSHMAHSNAADPLFSVLFEHIADEMNHLVKSPPGSEAHREEVWDCLKQADVLSSTGARVSMTRWFNWCEKYDLMDKQYYTHLFFFVLMAIQTGIYKIVYEAPIFGVETSLGKTAIKKANARLAKTSPLKEEAAANNIEEQRSTCKNQVELACVLIGQFALPIRARLALACLKPLWSAFGKEVNACRDNAFFDVQLSFARHGYSYTLLRVWRVLRNKEVLDSCQLSNAKCSSQFYTDQISSSPASSSNAPAPSPVPITWHVSDQESSHHVNLVWRLCWCLIRQRGMSMAQWTSLPPLRFITLLCPSSTVRRDTLAALRATWDTMVDVEHLQFVNPAIKPLLRKVGGLDQAT